MPSAKTEVISLDEWAYDDLYAAGISADEVIEEMEVGGFLDIGDTHVSVPWDEVEIADDGDPIILPLTDETIENYGIFDNDWIAAEEAATEIVAEVDDAVTGDRAWRVSELISDYARLVGEEPYSNYGYVNDVILSDGEVAAIVVEPSFEYGGGYRAYPYYGYGYGWTPGTPCYDLPYGETEVGKSSPSSTSASARCKRQRCPVPPAGLFAGGGHVSRSRLFTGKSETDERWSCPTSAPSDAVFFGRSASSFFSSGRRCLCCRCRESALRADSIGGGRQSRNRARNES